MHFQFFINKSKKLYRDIYYLSKEKLDLNIKNEKKRKEQKKSKWIKINI